MPEWINKYTHYKVLGEIIYPKLQRLRRWRLGMDK